MKSMNSFCIALFQMAVINLMVVVSCETCVGIKFQMAIYRTGFQFSQFCSTFPKVETNEGKVPEYLIDSGKGLLRHS